MKRERKKLLKKRRELSVLICRKAFKKYKQFEKADDINNNLYGLLNANKAILFSTFPKPSDLEIFFKSILLAS